MAERHRTPKMAQFLKDNKASLEEFGNRKGEKYVREPWMLKANPAAEHTVEIEVEDCQCDGN
ncbi:MAG TPA: hypothetical protein HPP54_02840 [Nitrospinae bacterium]|jgi:hypothetical protein|nr:hypothetical protein [Nitrospinota bacterium]|tara:strand:- start:41 stop:226 length:186 start_codon:yes stop_codon:yes gene_type:complete